MYIINTGKLYTRWWFFSYLFTPFIYAISRSRIPSGFKRAREGKSNNAAQLHSTFHLFCTKNEISDELKKLFNTFFSSFFPCHVGSRVHYTHWILLIKAQVQSLSAFAEWEEEKKRLNCVRVFFNLYWPLARALPHHRQKLYNLRSLLASSPSAKKRVSRVLPHSPKSNQVKLVFFLHFFFVEFFCVLLCI